MNIDNIEAFVYVNHYGSFNKAAEALYLSQPSVTSRIQTLERELDAKLFERQAKGVQLTETGKTFLPYAQQILQTYRKGKLHLQKKPSVPQELRIGSTVSVSTYIIPELLPFLKSRFPELTFKLTTATTDELGMRLLDQEIDLAFVRKLAHPSLRSYPLYDDPIRLYVYEGHPFAARGRIALSELTGEKLVFFECGSLDWLRLHRVFESLEHPPDIVCQADQSETAKKLVLGRAGIAFLPGVCIREEAAQGRLVPVEIAETAGISLQTSLSVRSGEHAELAEAIRSFHAFSMIE
ncbi:LysR family transcriptional regulator [Paenibacillus albicereus]|uniref:LysR family transcriptional regulator n=1 Tax=Paenibacillus albicereus TaxID=2726185 RepID=A0A6H2GSR5_9BACL|nr:LysR family transcriptional regulator [Paenibacillus albicereus]QJC50435.1 LysR family transcriptional regulator [Paenibacillus albicereus]